VNWASFGNPNGGEELRASTLLVASGTDFSRMFTRLVKDRALDAERRARWRESFERI
jgi:hypothetical protein